MANDEIILEPDPARVMEGLRDTGYDFNTAMADLVDNSIAAFATKVKVTIQMSPKGELTLYIADNGCGMDMEGLKNAMRYGSSRRADASSLGKFGLGLKTASTAFCKRLSVVSKIKNGEYNKVCWDLDEIVVINKWKLLQPKITQDEKDILEDVTGGDAGTLVIWENVDRLMKTYSRHGAAQNAFKKILSSLRQHFAMVYQRFLDKSKGCHKFTLIVNGQKVEPWDPFCAQEPNRQLLAEEKIKVELPNGKFTSFKLEAWLLPRVEEFSSAQAKSEARISNDMEGFYVYRENRLIYFGGWLGMFISDPHISLLRVNFSFDHTLDDALNVDIKKSRINLNEDIFEYIKNNFLPAPRRAAADLYRKGRNAAIVKESNGVHTSSSQIIEDKAKSVENSKIQIVDEDKGEIKIDNSNGGYKTTIKISTPTEHGGYRVIPIPQIDGGLLWEPTLVDGKHAVMINQGHEYYTKVYAPVLQNSVLVAGMDSLLWALAEAELSTCNEASKEQFEDLKYEVSKILRKLVKDLPGPNIENYGDPNA